MDEKMKRVSLDTAIKLLETWIGAPQEAQDKTLGFIQGVMAMSKPVAESEKQPA